MQAKLRRQKYNVVVVGCGLAGLAVAVRINQLRPDLKVAIFGQGAGASRFISGLNAAMPGNPFGDSPESHATDMLEAGRYIGDKDLAAQMCKEAPRAVHWLEELGVRFARNGSVFSCRRAAGSSNPRTLFSHEGYLGASIVQRLTGFLRERGVRVQSGLRCLQLISAEERITGVLCTNQESEFVVVTAPLIVAAWGGAGRLFDNSTYPQDVDGRGLAMAYELGASLTDLEFIEFEPTVFLHPPGLRGELFLTALFGEGAHLRNSKNERFIFNYDRGGEAGCPKTTLNQAIWGEVRQGRGSAHGGVYADIRHLPLSKVQAFPWFVNRLEGEGMVFSRDLLEVGPAPHSHSGGVKVNSRYQTDVFGLYAVGEASGGIHGACRLGGNSATQTVVSGILAAESLVQEDPPRNVVADLVSIKLPSIDKTAHLALLAAVRPIVAEVMSGTKSHEDVLRAVTEIDKLLQADQAKEDDPSRQSLLSIKLILLSRLERRETRGNLLRSDYPTENNRFIGSISVKKDQVGDPVWKFRGM